MKILLAAFMAVALLRAAAGAENIRVRDHAVVQTIGKDDIEAEVAFGKEIAARILGKYPLYQNEALTRYVNLVAKSLGQYGNRPELSFTVGVLDTDMINGFSAPGGYVFITKGAVDAMRDESELAAVIAHEMTHVSQRHIVKELNIHGTDSSPASGFARMIGGASESVKITFLKAVDEGMNILFERGYKKTDEIEADTMGTLLIGTAGYDPSALVRYFNRVKAGLEKETAAIKRLHPTFDERIEWINKAIDENGLTGGGFKTRKERFDGVLGGKG